MRLSYVLVGVTVCALTANNKCFADQPSTRPATQSATKTYTFRGHTVSYPDSWRLREKPGGGPAMIYLPAGDDALSASWLFDRKSDRAQRTAEQVRDDIAAALAKTMKGFQLKDKGALTIDGRPAAYVTYTHAVVDPPAVERQIFVPTGDGFVIVAVESAVASVWEAESPKLDRITRSLRFPK